MMIPIIRSAACALALGALGATSALATPAPNAAPNAASGAATTSEAKSGAKQYHDRYDRDRHHRYDRRDGYRGHHDRDRYDRDRYRSHHDRYRYGNRYSSRYDHYRGYGSRYGSSGLTVRFGYNTPRTSHDRMRYGYTGHTRTGCWAERRNSRYQGRPAVVTVQVCRDRYGRQYVDPRSTRLVYYLTSSNYYRRW